MRRILVWALLLCCGLPALAELISSVEEGGSWIYTWTKEGKKINTRPAQ